MEREAFLARVRSAAAAGRAYRVQPSGGLDPQPGRGIAPDEDPVARFVREVASLGGKAARVPDEAAAAAFLETFLDEYRPRSILAWEDPVLERLGMFEQARRRGCKVWTHHELAGLPAADRQAAILAADVGITGTTWAVAETGSLAVASGPGTERTASLLPPVHLAVVTRDRILPDLYDLFARIETAPAPLPASNWVLISGPSKTGDIEMNLVVGVHGPGRWHVLTIG